MTSIWRGATVAAALVLAMSARVIAQPTVAPAAAAAGGRAGQEAPARHALVIGNARYAEAPLRNPENDARDLAQALAQLGFQVTLVLHADRAAMLAAVAAYARKLDADALSLVFFGGHGVQAGGRNYLLPILPPGRSLAKADDLAAQAVSLDSLIAPLAAARPRFNVVVLDACRDNPFGDGRLQGLAPLEAPPNTLLAFATSPGKVAYDGAGRNGTYTAHLLRHIGRRDLRIEEVFKLVRAGVLEESRGRQLPWENTALTGELALGHYPQALPAAGADGTPVAWIRDAAEPELRRYLAENRDARVRSLVTARLVALRERTPIRAEALALAERPCPECPRMREVVLPGRGAGQATGQGAAPGTAQGLGASLWAASDLVTAGELRRCVAARACAAPPELALAADTDPAQGVSMPIAAQYVAWLNTQRQAGAFAAKPLGFFLPSEAQWRAVYRASFFDERGRPLFEGRSACRVANLYDESGAAAHRFGWAAFGCNDGFAEAAPVGLYLPSLLGLFDVVGNVWQWTGTCVEGGSAPSSGTDRACRAYRLLGGSWATGSQWSWDAPPALTAEPELGAPIFGLRVFGSAR